MGKYMFTFQYSAGSWARLVKASDDRAVAGRSLLACLGGSLDVLYWSAQSSAAYAIVELPDAISAKAAVTAGFETGAFASVDVEELLSQEQLNDMLMLTRAAEEFYVAPGRSVVEPSY